MPYLKLFYKKIPRFSKLDIVAEKIEIANFKSLPMSILYFANYDLQPACVTNEEGQFAAPFPNEVWEHLANDRSSIFMFDTSYESLSIPYLLLQLKYLTSKLNIKQEQIYVILPDELHTCRLEEMLAEFGMNYINFDFYNHWLYSISLSEINSKPSYCTERTKILKFSLLSRKYTDDRLLLFIELVNEGLINKCLYTFHNIFPYGTNEEVMNSAKSLAYMESIIPVDYNDNIELIKKWLRGIPYSIETDELPLNIGKDALNLLIKESDVHIVVETFYDRNAGQSWITEKTYKAMACKKPLIFYTTPFALKDLRKLGFKTYSPYINESYDLITDSVLRRKAIVAEVKRISSFNNEEATQFINQCNIISEYNATILFKKYSSRLEKFKQLGIFK